MKYLLLSATILLCWISNGCVQKAYRKTVVVTVTVKTIKDIKSVGIRGNGKPLSWDNDFIMEPVIKDSLYRAVVSTVTGYKFAEVKFTVNGQFELNEQPNRRIELSEKDTTYYNAVFDSIK
jgi:hypothetical protein